MTALDGSLEIGVRVVFFLNSAFPHSFDVNQLVLADHFVLHSEDHGGPSSLHPSIALQAGEIGRKRSLMAEALSQMVHAGMVEVISDESGIKFAASERTSSFVRLFRSGYAERLKDLSEWVAHDMWEEPAEESIRRMENIVSQWATSAASIEEI